MNRELYSSFQAFGGSGERSVDKDKGWKRSRRRAMVLDGAQKVIVVPATEWPSKSTRSKGICRFNGITGCKVLYAIHPVAGRMLDI